MYLDEDAGGKGLVGVEGGMGFGMTLDSLTRDSIISKAHSFADRDSEDLILAAQREYAFRNQKKKYSTRIPGTIEVRRVPSCQWYL